MLWGIEGPTHRKFKQSEPSLNSVHRIRAMNDRVIMRLQWIVYTSLIQINFQSIVMTASYLESIHVPTPDVVIDGPSENIYGVFVNGGCMEQATGRDLKMSNICCFTGIDSSDSSHAGNTLLQVINVVLLTYLLVKFNLSHWLYGLADEFQDWMMNSYKWRRIRHCGLAETARNGKGWEFKSWQCQIRVPCS